MGVFRAADWNLQEPQWTGRMRLVAKAEELIMKLEDKTSGELFAKCPIDKYPGVALESVTDSSRYFVVRIQDDNGKIIFILCLFIYLFYIRFQNSNIGILFNFRSNSLHRSRIRRSIRFIWLERRPTRSFQMVEKRTGRRTGSSTKPWLGLQRRGNNKNKHEDHSKY